MHEMTQISAWSDANGSVKWRRLRQAMLQSIK